MLNFVLMVLVGSFVSAVTVMPFDEFSQLWSKDGTSNKQGTLFHQPIMLTNTPAMLWNMNHSAVQDALADCELQIKNLSNSNGQIGLFSWGCCELMKTTVKEFITQAMKLDEDDDLPPPFYLYFSALLNTLPKTVETRIDELSQPSHEFHIPFDTTRDWFRADQVKYRKSIWMSSRASITTLHHDEVHNIFVQVHGVKTFKMLAPEHWRNLGLYPKSHVRHRNVQTEQCVLGRTHPQCAAMFHDMLSRVHEKDWITIKVQPGDVLYIPPHMFHEVKSESFSISMNNWSPAYQIESAFDAWNVHVPFDNVSDEHLVRMCGWFVGRIVDLLLSVRNKTQFIRDLATSRFRHSGWVSSWLTHDVSLHSLEYKFKQHANHDVNELTPAFLPGLSRDAVAGMCASSSSSAQETMIKTLQEPFEMAAQEVAEKFHTTLTFGSRGSLEIMLGHYIEDVISQIVGDDVIVHVLDLCVIEEDVCGKL